MYSNQICWLHCHSCTTSLVMKQLNELLGIRTQLAFLLSFQKIRNNHLLQVGTSCLQHTNGNHPEEGISYKSSVYTYHDKQKNQNHIFQSSSTKKEIGEIFPQRFFSTGIQNSKASEEQRRTFTISELCFKIPAREILKCLHSAFQ